MSNKYWEVIQKNTDMMKAKVLWHMGQDNLVMIRSSIVVAYPKAWGIGQGFLILKQGYETIHSQILKLCISYRASIASVTEMYWG